MFVEYTNQDFAFDHEWTQQYCPLLYLTVNGHFVCDSETIIIRSESNFQCFIYKWYVFFVFVQFLVLENLGFSCIFSPKF